MQGLLLLCYVVICFVTYTNGFATKESYSTNPIMEAIDILDFGDTKFHDTQAITAICITQYRYLLRNKMNLPLPPEPKFYEACPYIQMFKGDNNAEKIAKTAMWKLIDAVTDPDSCLFEFPPKKVNDPTYHYDAEEKLPETNKRVIQRRINAYKAKLNWNGQYDSEYETIVELVGNNIHALQDFYSHTNWIEMGNTDINLNVGLNGDLGVPILPPEATSCTICTFEDMTPAERRQYDKFANSPFSHAIFGSIPCLKGSSRYVFACRNNVATNGLTSGYYGAEEAAPKPSSGIKCSHGGGYDESDAQPATGGISKDADTLFLAPHYYLHQEAAKLSVEATIQYLEDFRLSLNDETKFGSFIGIPRIPSVGIAIVIDTTESMKSQWNDVIAEVTRDIDEFEKNYPSKIITYFLTPFNDPDFGFPTEDGGVYHTNSSAELIQKLNILKAEGGGDIPEMCLPAILSTVKKIGLGNEIYVYTDANSKKPELLQQIGVIATGKNIKISFTMFGENSPNVVISSSTDMLRRYSHHFLFQMFQALPFPAPVVVESSSNESTSTLQDYINLSQLTNGFYVNYRKDDKQKQRYATKNNLRNDWEIIDSDTIADTTSFNYSFIVDDTMSYIEIEMDLLFGGETIRNLNINISSPLSPLPLIENVTTDTVRIFTYSNPTPGNWTININNIDVSQIILLKILSPSYLDVHIRVLPSANSTQSVRAPIIGEGKYDIFVECFSCKTVDSLIVTPCGNESKYFESSPAFVPGFNWWYLTEVKFPAAGGLICFEMNGTTLRGNRFTRLVDKKISLTSVGIKGNVSDTEIFNHQNASLSYYITNYGAADSFNLTISSNKNINLSFDQKTYYIDSYSSANDTVEISLSNANVSSIYLELTATSQRTPSISVQQNFFISVLNSGDDIAAPVCNILEDGNSTCPDDCSGHKYDVKVEYYDDGTGVYRVYAEDGEWSIPNIDTSDPNPKFIATGKLDCCAEISKFFVFDKNGLIGRCIFKNDAKIISTSSPTTTPAINTTTTTENPTTSGSAKDDKHYVAKWDGQIIKIQQDNIVTNIINETLPFEERFTLFKHIYAGGRIAIKTIAFVSALLTLIFIDVKTVPESKMLLWLIKCCCSVLAFSVLCTSLVFWYVKKTVIYQGREKNGEINVRLWRWTSEMERFGHKYILSAEFHKYNKVIPLVKHQFQKILDHISLMI